MPSKKELIEELKEKGIDANDSLSKANLEDLLSQANSDSGNSTEPEKKEVKVEEKVYLGQTYVEDASDKQVRDFQKEGVLIGWNPKTREALIKQ